MIKILLTHIGLTLVLLTTACSTSKPGGDLSSAGGIPVLPVKHDCDQAELVGETIPPGAEYLAGEKFIKTWTIRNISPCVWTDQFSLVYYDGDGMGGTTHVSFAENLPSGTVFPPGTTITLTLDLRVPFMPGSQVGYWKLRDPSGILFMPVNVEQDSLLVSIQVVGSIYNFAERLCDAQWMSNGSAMACGNETVNMHPSVMVEHFPKTEEELKEDVAAIRFVLPDFEGAVIQGVYPEIEIHRGDHLHFTTTCGQDLPACHLDYVVSYRVGSEEGILGAWRETSDSKMQVVDIDLSALDGKKVQFLFSVTAVDSSLDNLGYLVLPVILPY